MGQKSHVAIPFPLEEIQFDPCITAITQGAIGSRRTGLRSMLREEEAGGIWEAQADSLPEE